MSSQSIPSEALSASDPSIIITEENSRREQPADFTCRPVFNPVPSCGTNFLPVMVPDRDLEVKELPQQPLDLFHHFVPYFLVAKWVKYTNEWVDHLLRSRSWKPRARIRSWKPTTVPEVYLWLALLIHIGIHKEITIRDHWKTSRLGHQGSNHSILKVMTFDRFQLLHRHLRLFNPFSLAKEAAKAGLAKVFAAVDEWSRHLQYASTEFLKPGMNIAVDECMIRYTGRSYQTTRVPNKPIPVGFKIWATAQKGLFLRWLWHEPKKRYGPVSLVRGFDLREEGDFTHTSTRHKAWLFPLLISCQKPYITSSLITSSRPLTSLEASVNMATGPQARPAATVVSTPPSRSLKRMILLAGGSFSSMRSEALQQLIIRQQAKSNLPMETLLI